MSTTLPLDSAPTPATGADETRDRLVAAAAEVFAEKGYEGARVQEIARRAGLTTGAIYSRYSGKAELLAEAIRDEASPQFDALFASAVPAMAASDLLARAGAHLVTRDATRKEGLLLEAFVAARRDPDLRGELQRLLDERVRAFGRLIELAKRSGDVDPSFDTDSVVRFCQAVGLGFLLYEAIEAPRPEPAAWRQLVQHLVAAMADPPATLASDTSRHDAHESDPDPAQQGD